MVRQVLKSVYIYYKQKGENGARAPAAGRETGKDGSHGGRRARQANSTPL